MSIAAPGLWLPPSMRPRRLRDWLPVWAVDIYRDWNTNKILRAAGGEPMRECCCDLTCDSSYCEYCCYCSPVDYEVAFSGINFCACTGISGGGGGPKSFKVLTASPYSGTHCATVAGGSPGICSWLLQDFTTPFAVAGEWYIGVDDCSGSPSGVDDAQGYVEILLQRTATQWTLIGSMGGTGGNWPAVFFCATLAAVEGEHCDEPLEFTNTYDDSTDCILFPTGGGHCAGDLASVIGYGGTATVTPCC